MSKLSSIPSEKPFSSLLKIFAKHMTAYCKRCKKERSDLLFDYYKNRETELCNDCLIHAKIFVFLVDSFFSSLKIEREKIPAFFNKEYRKISKSIIKGIANFGIRKPFVTGTPVAVVWNYTDRCNLKCGHCYANSNSLKMPELTTKERLKIIDRLVEADVFGLNFSGGEPLVRKDFFKVAKYANDNEIKISLSTNATLITKACVQKLMECGIEKVQISLDGVKPETHERIRNVKGSFDLAVKGIKNCVKYGNFSDITVNTTLTKFTLKEIPRIYEFVKTLGATRYYVSRILPSGRGKDFLKFDVTPEEKIQVMNFLSEKFRSSINGGDDILCLARGMTYFSRVCHDNSFGNVFPVCEVLTGYEREHLKNIGEGLPSMIVRMKGYFSGCATGLNYCGLDPTGEVLPCAPASDIKLGNLLENSLEDIWVNHPIFKKIRDRNNLKGKCSECRAKEYCGGCRLTSFGVTGDWLAEDPSCPFN